MEGRTFPAEYSLETTFDIFSIVSIYIFRFTPSYKMDIELHNTLELIYVDIGSEEVFEDDKVYTVSKGEMFLHKPNSPHKDRCISPTSTCYIVSFRANTEAFTPFFDKVISLSKKEITQLKEFFEMFLNNISAPIEKVAPERKVAFEYNTHGIAQILKNKFELFFLSILNSSEKEITSIRNFEDPLIQKIIAELYQNRFEKFSLAKISDALSYSKSYLCRHFKNTTNTTIINHFYSIKIEESKKMLISGEHTIEEVSDLLGFDSVQYFSKVFKKYVGLTPSTWKNISTERMYF